MSLPWTTHELMSVEATYRKDGIEAAIAVSNGRTRSAVKRMAKDRKWTIDYPAPGSINRRIIETIQAKGTWMTVTEVTNMLGGSRRDIGTAMRKLHCRGFLERQFAHICSHQGYEYKFPVG